MNAAQPNANLALTLCQNLFADYSTTTDSNYKASLSNVLVFKLSTLTTFVTMSNQGMLSQIAKLSPHNA